MSSLIQHAREKDVDAFSTLVKQNQVSLYKIAMTILLNHEDAEDAVQETILICWEKIGALKHDEYFRTWLTRILMNQCYAILRRRKRFVPMEGEDPGMNETGFSSVEWGELVAHLDEKYRTVIVLYYVEGFNTREIAALLKKNINTVKSRLSKARKQCERFLTEGGYDEAI